MSSLFDSLSSNISDNSINKTSFEEGNFVEKLAMYRDVAVNDFRKFNVDLNQSIAKIASANNLNDDQIQRIVEEANTQVYLLKYAEMKRFPQREVVFPIAKVASVKDIMQNGVKKNEPVIEKKASWEENGEEDSRNFLNYTSHETIGLAPEVNKELKEIIAEKLAHEINLVDEVLQEKKAAFNDNIYTIADAFIKYDRANKNAQGMFEQMCKEASIHKAEQCVINSAIEQKISQMKEYKLASEEYSFKLELVDIEKQADDFSLGKYSLIKTASMKQGNSDAHIVVTDNGKVIKNVSDLVNMARNIGKQKNEIKDAESKKDKLMNLKKKE